MQRIQTKTYTKSGTIEMEFGSIISYTAQFILASDIK